MCMKIHFAIFEVQIFRYIYSVEREFSEGIREKKTIKEKNKKRKKNVVLRGCSNLRFDTKRKSNFLLNRLIFLVTITLSVMKKIE